MAGMYSDSLYVYPPSINIAWAVAAILALQTQLSFTSSSYSVPSAGLDNLKILIEDFEMEKRNLVSKYCQ